MRWVKLVPPSDHHILCVFCTVLVLHDLVWNSIGKTGLRQQGEIALDHVPATTRRPRAHACAAPRPVRLHLQRARTRHRSGRPAERDLERARRHRQPAGRPPTARPWPPRARPPTRPGALGHRHRHRGPAHGPRGTRRATRGAPLPPHGGRRAHCHGRTSSEMPIRVTTFVDVVFRTQAVRA